MRRRALTTTKILAVALTLGPACTKPNVQPEPPAASSAPVASVVASATESVDPKLALLREDLANTKRADALANLARFRPLCDKDGYPLVGNLARKAPDSNIEVSQLCGEVRKQTR